GAAVAVEEMLDDALSALMELPGYRCGVAYLLEEGGVAARRLSMLGFARSEPPRKIRWDEGVFPATALFSRGIEAAWPDTGMHPQVKEILGRERLGGIIAVPLVPGGQPLGMLLLGHDFEARQVEEDRPVMRAAADAFDLGAENLLFRARAEERAREATAMYRVARSMTEEVALDRTLECLVEEAIDLFKVDICSIFLYDEETGLLTCRAAEGADVVSMEVPLGDSGTASLAAKTLKRVVVDDAEADRRVPRFVIEEHGVRSSLVAPLIVDGKFAGALFLDMREKRSYSKRELELIDSFAEQAALVVRDASLLDGLRKSEERYRLVVESTEDIVFTTDVDSRFTFVNERVRSVLGSGPEELLGFGYLQYVDEADMGYLEAVINIISSGGTIREARLHLHDRDGAEVLLDTKISPIVVDGRVTGAVGVARDVTEQVKAEGAVLASEERYRTLVETSPNAVLITNLHGEILFVNSKSADLAGIPPEALIGKNVDDLLAPEEVKKVGEEFKAALATGRGLAGRLTRAITDGTERYFEASTSVIGEPGTDARVMIIANDVTERELARRALADSEERYRAIVEASKDVILMINRGGEILYVNPEVERTFGAKPEDVTGRHIFGFVHPDDRERVAEGIANAFRRGFADMYFPATCLAVDGSLVRVEVNSGLVGWPGEDAVEIMVIRDVTERKKREEETVLRLKVEEALADVAVGFVNPENIYEAIGRTLEQTGELLGVSRVHYFEFSRDGERLSCKSEWVGEGTEPTIDTLQSLDPADYPWWVETLGSGAMVVRSFIEEIPEESMRRKLARQGVLAVAAAPIFERERLAGFFSYHDVQKNREWSGPEVGMLREVSETISHALERREWVVELERSEKFRARITESIGEGLMVLRNGVVTWVNLQTCKILGYGPEELMGHTTENLFPDAKRLEVVALETATALARGERYEREGKARRKDGSLVDVLVTLSSLGAVAEDYAEVVATISDITESRRMREQVEAAAEAYSTIFLVAGDGLVVSSLDGEIRDVNERICSYTGFSREELLSKNMADLVPEKVRHLYKERLGEVLHDGYTTFETKLIRKDGGRLPVEASSRAATVLGERVILSALHDITERKIAEVETKRRAVQLASLNEILKAATRSLNLDVALKDTLSASIEVSGAEAGILTLEDQPGAGTSRVMSSEGFTPELMVKLDTDVMKRGLAELASGPEGAAVIDVPSWAATEKGGEIVSLLEDEGIESALFIPLARDESVTGVLGLASKKPGLFSENYRDFYNAAGAEIRVAMQNAIIYRELLAEHERLALLYRSAQDISEQAGLDTLLKTVAKEATEAIGAESAFIALVEPGRDEFVWAAAHNMDLGLLEGIHMPTDKGFGGEVIRSKRAASIETGDGVPKEITEEDPVAGVFWGKTGLLIPLIAGDEVVGIMSLQCLREQEVSDEDVLLLEAMGRHAGVAIENARLYEETRTHLQALEVAHQELMELDRMKSDFVSTVSHELRSPLAVIEGFARTLVEHFDRIDRDTERESLEIILKKSTILEGLIANILDMSRIEAGRLEVNLEVVGLLDLCRRVIGDQERMADVSGIKLVAPDKELAVVADPDRAEVVLGNLVRNAIKFSPESGTVLIAIKEEGEMAEVSVIDEGIGIPAEEHAKIFGRFYQVESGENRSFPGTGLGLYITSELLHAMGGTIKVDSEPGKGSTFTITLPLAGRAGVAEGPA
ncbi:MAG: PAS domain S-box protein, partial [Actinobacteria bacterium]|nr:PAS domain S-box protein [Actinomycetota bacterium]